MGKTTKNVSSVCGGIVVMVIFVLLQYLLSRLSLIQWLTDLNIRAILGAEICPIEEDIP